MWRFLRAIPADCVPEPDTGFSRHSRARALLGRMEVETDDIPEFLLELRIFRQLECTRAMRLQVVTLPDRVDRVARDADFLRHAAQTPSRPSRWRLGHFHDDLFDCLHGHPRFASPSRFVVQAVQAGVLEAPRPLADARQADVQSFSHFLDLDPFAPEQDNLGAQAIALRTRAGTNPAL